MEINMFECATQVACIPCGKFIFMIMFTHTHAQENKENKTETEFFLFQSVPGTRIVILPSY